MGFALGGSWLGFRCSDDLDWLFAFWDFSVDVALLALVGFHLAPSGGSYSSKSQSVLLCLVFIFIEVLVLFCSLLWLLFAVVLSGWFWSLALLGAGILVW